MTASAAPAMKVAVIGVGAFGREHAAIYARLPSVDLVGVVDLDDGARQAAAIDFTTAPFRSVLDLLDTVQVDAVSVAIPARYRPALYAQLAAAPGRPPAMLIEKPLAETASEAEKWLAHWSGHTVLVGHLLRFAQPYRQLAAALSHAPPQQGSLSGLAAVGALTPTIPPTAGRTTADCALARIRPAYHHLLYPSEDVIGLTMIHDLDALPWLAGARPRRVTAVGERETDGRWVEVRADIALDNGETWQVVAAWTGPHRDYARARGWELTLTEDVGELRHDDDVQVVPGAGETYDDALADEIAHFVDCVRSGVSSDRLRLADAAAAVHLADTVRRALATGEPIDC